MFERIVGTRVAPVFVVCSLFSCAGGNPDPSPRASCTTDADCRTFSDYCTGCDCRALAVSESAPVCQGPGVRCLVDPCRAEHAVCQQGRCALAAPVASACAAVLCLTGTTCTVEDGQPVCR
jgi:hypothetical protein